jgi:hypothetical protein
LENEVGVGRMDVETPVAELGAGDVEQVFKSDRVASVWGWSAPGARECVDRIGHGVLRLP